MQIQVVCCHPLTESYDHALFRTVVGTLGSRTAIVSWRPTSIAKASQPAMTIRERRTYMGNDYDESAVARYVETLKKVDGLILCFPHWWFSMPAMLKGWVDRVWGPGTAFTYDPDDGHLRPNLANIKLFGVVTSYGSPWWIVRVFAGDAGRKVLMRGMKPLCATDVKSFYLAHYGMDASTPGSREIFLEKVRSRVAQLDGDKVAQLPATNPPRQHFSADGGHHVAQVPDYIGTFGDLADRLRPATADREARSQRLRSRGVGGRLSPSTHRPTSRPTAAPTPTPSNVSAKKAAKPMNARLR